MVRVNVAGEYTSCHNPRIRHCFKALHPSPLGLAPRSCRAEGVGLMIGQASWCGASGPHATPSALTAKLANRRACVHSSAAKMSGMTSRCRVGWNPLSGCSNPRAAR
jgi:hypothetical protein